MIARAWTRAAGAAAPPRSPITGGVRRGSDRSAVGAGAAADPRTEAARRSARAAAPRPARGAQWHSLDPTHRRALEGSARALSVLPDVSSALPAVGTRRDA